MQENYLKKKRKLQNEEDKKLRKEEEEEFNLDINLDIRGDIDDEEEKNSNKINNNINIGLYEEDNVHKINLESFTNTNSEHYMNNSENNNGMKNEVNIIKIYEPSSDILNSNKINFILNEKNKKIKISDEKYDKEKENINNENEKNDENKINQNQNENSNIFTKRRNTVLSGIDEFDDFLNSYDKVNQQLKSSSIKKNMQNIQLNFEGNQFSIKKNNNTDTKMKLLLDVDKYKLNN